MCRGQRKPRCFRDLRDSLCSPSSNGSQPGSVTVRNLKTKVSAHFLRPVVFFAKERTKKCHGSPDTSVSIHSLSFASFHLIKSRTKHARQERTNIAPILIRSSSAFHLNGDLTRVLEAFFFFN